MKPIVVAVQMIQTSLFGFDIIDGNEHLCRYLLKPTDTTWMLECDEYSFHFDRNISRPVIEDYLKEIGFLVTKFVPLGDKETWELTLVDEADFLEWTLQLS